MLDDRRRRRWMRARAVLRELLGRYLQSDPQALRFATEATGKPILHMGSDPSFNVSHSGSLAIYAFIRSGSVGVDVEVARHSIDEIAVARRAFGLLELSRLQELPPIGRRREFLRAWTRREAGLKCSGTGLRGEEQDTPGPPAWTLGLEMGPEAAAAVATRRQPDQLICWEWLQSWQGRPA
jgi:4'-phosphopantetheinyl transferase